jgi:signal transduction histidine kinase
MKNELFSRSRSVEEKIIEGIISIFVFGNLIYCVHDVIFSDYTWLSLASLIMVIGGLIALYFLVFRNRYKQLIKPIIIILLIIHIAEFFQLNGFNSTLSLDFVNIGFAIVFVFQGKDRIFFLSAFFIIVVSLLLAQLFIPDIPDVYNDNVVLDTSIHVVLSLYLGYVIKREYDKSQDMILEKNKELEEKNNEILTQNEEIIAINDSLAETVNRRTQQLEEKIQKMTAYSYQNSHEVRAPLARILGLIEVIRIEQSADMNQINYYLENIRKSANELDNVIKSMNETLGDKSK